MNKLKEEALVRMIKLGLTPECINEFKENDRLCYSYDCNLFEFNEKMMKITSEFEKKYNAKVYHGILNNNLNNGTQMMISLFYVCSCMEEWSMDHEDLQDNIQVVYVHNFLNNDCSEIGTIGFKKDNGILQRVS